MKLLLCLLLSIITISAKAKTQVLFHPHDRTLDLIATWIQEAQSQVDIAMYSMDVTDQSPVIQILKSETVQQRLKTGELKIRMIYEGYSTKEDNQKRMSEIERLNIDVRYLGKSVKVHHKFAVIDPASAAERVITGSANWSLSSYRNYNENILFFENEAEMTYRFQSEFQRLWKNAKEFGRTVDYGAIPLPGAVQQDEIDVHFNSPRLVEQVSDHALLTDQLIRQIKGAQREIDIATTRIRIEPVLGALTAAADRGVRIRIVISQDDYHDLWRRSRWLFSNRNIQLRVKFYNFKVSAYMAYQMHHKFMIVDRTTIMTGSFNWSYSAENQHIENLVEVWGTKAQEVMNEYQNEFDSIWTMGRAQLEDFKKELELQRSIGEIPKCAFTPTALEVLEIKKLLKENKDCGRKTPN